MSFYKEGIEKTPIVGDIKKLEEQIKISKENGCKLLECKTIDDNIALRRENIKLKKEISKYQAKSEEDEAVIEEATRLLYEDDTSFGYGRLKEINTQEKIKEYIRNLVKGEKE